MDHDKSAILMQKNAVIIFLKFPEKNKVKTRLAEKLDPGLAEKIYKCFILDMMDTLNESGYDIKVFTNSAGSIAKFKRWKNFKYDFYIQEGDDIGRKMFNAFKNIFSENYEKIILIGSDIPEINLKIINDAFKNLDSNQAVIGPAVDGGYYLIGLEKNHLNERIFEGVAWSTSKVFEQTMDNILISGLTCKTLDYLSDIDYYEDLKSYFLKNKSAENNTIKFLKKTGIFDGR
jgi:uncharacterized protein